MWNIQTKRLFIYLAPKSFIGRSVKQVIKRSKTDEPGRIHRYSKNFCDTYGTACFLCHTVIMIKGPKYGSTQMVLISVSLPFNWTSERSKGNQSQLSFKAGHIHVNPLFQCHNVHKWELVCNPLESFIFQWLSYGNKTL